MLQKMRKNKRLSTSLPEQENLAAVDGAVTSNDAIAGDLVLLHTEVNAVMLHKCIIFIEASFVKKEIDSLTSGKLSSLVLRVNALLATTEQDLFPLVVDFTAHLKGVGSASDFSTRKGLLHK